MEKEDGIQAEAYLNMLAWGAALTIYSMCASEVPPSPTPYSQATQEGRTLAISEHFQVPSSIPQLALI